MTILDERLDATDGQDHNVDPAVLAPVLTAFLS